MDSVSFGTHVHGGENRAAVIGGSIGGLTAALCLRDGGWDVDVFERSRALLEGRGAGIVLHPATIRYLAERTGLGPEEISVSARWLRYLDAAGAVAHQQPCLFRFTSYDALYRRLLASFGRERYHLGEECVGLDDPEGAAGLAFASGRAAPTDLVVFADGINSAGRRLLAPRAEPRYAGYVAWRGTALESGVGPAVFAELAEAITYCILPDGHVIAYPIPAPAGSVRLLNWLWYRNVADAELEELLPGSGGTRLATSIPPGQVPSGRLAELLRLAEANLPPALAEIVVRTAEPFVQVIVDVAAERTALGRACLIGDAAFAARPHVAVGTAKAADDAWTLGAALAGVPGDVESALREWSRAQTALGRSVVERSREVGVRLQNGTWPVGEPLPYGLRRVGDSSFAAGL